jgi:ribosomal protein S18 acetylase RimI-like enzyme
LQKLTSSPLIRRINQDDKNELLELLKLAFNEIFSKRGGPELLKDLEVFDDTLKAWDQLTNSYSFVCLTRDEITGFISVTALKSAVKINYLWVVPEMRRKKIASELLKYALTELNTDDLITLEANALPGDLAAKSFFESMKMKARLLVMRGVISLA